MGDRLFDDLLELRRQRARAHADVDEQHDRQEAQVVKMLREKYTWEQIGEALGVTRQAAWERYGRKVEEG